MPAEPVVVLSNTVWDPTTISEDPHLLPAYNEASLSVGPKTAATIFLLLVNRISRFWSARCHTNAQAST